MGVDEEVATFTSTGRRLHNTPGNDLDLFMAPPETVERWVNVYSTHETQEQADHYAGGDRLACVKIDYEV